MKKIVIPIKIRINMKDEKEAVQALNNHASKCILRGPCTLASGDSCNARCPSYVAMHGFSGTGGRVGSAGVPADYRLLTLATSPVAKADIDVYVGPDKRKLNAIIREYVSTFTRMFDGGERVKSLYLYSESPGTGKTTTAAALINEWLIVNYIGSLKRGRQPFDRPAVFLDVNEWQSLYNQFNRPRVPDSIAQPAAARYYEAQEAAKSAPFAVLDDIGLREASEGFRGDLHAIINERVTSGRPTVYTSNLPMAEMADVFDARLADRIRDQCVELNFTGTSKRGMRKTNGGER